MTIRARVALVLAGASLALPAAADDTGVDCSAWGEVTPDQRTVGLGEIVEFFVAGGRSCGDPDTCTWSADEDRGDFWEDVGSPVRWQAPHELADCIPETFRVYVACTDGDTLGSSEITVRCSDAEMDEVAGHRDDTVGGGGCGSQAQPDYAVGIVPALWLVLRRGRRRSTALR